MKPRGDNILTNAGLFAVYLVCLVAVAFILTMVAGCATTSPPVAMGDGTYVTSASATWEYGGHGGALAQAYRSAADECARVGKRPVVKDEAMGTAGAGIGHQTASVRLTFVCR